MSEKKLSERITDDRLRDLRQIAKSPAFRMSGPKVGRVADMLTEALDEMDRLRVLESSRDRMAERIKELEGALEAFAEWHDKTGPCFCGLTGPRTVHDARCHAARAALADAPGEKAAELGKPQTGAPEPYSCRECGSPPGELHEFDCTWGCHENNGRGLRCELPSLHDGKHQNTRSGKLITWAGSSHDAPATPSTGGGHHPACLCCKCCDGAPDK